MPTERLIKLEHITPLEFFGVNNANIDFVQQQFPQLKIIVRGNDIKLVGPENEIENAEHVFHFMRVHHEKFGTISKNDIQQILGSSDSENEYLLEEKAKGDDVIVLGRNKREIKARTASQKKMAEVILKKDMLFAIGPAGTGKTYTAVAMAVRSLRNKEVRRIVLTRPAVEAGESLGYLPGDLRDKLDPYLQPLYDALRDMIPHSKLLSYFEDGTIEIAPLAFMRGRTLDHAFVILDEAQNATVSQLKMFLTRMGKAAKFVITGDVTQVDLPRNQKSGLRVAHDLLGGISDIEFIFLNEKDVVRHKLVTKIVKAYKQIEDQNATK